MTSERTIAVGAGESQSTMSREDMVALFKRRQEAYDDLDAAALAADYADDAVIDSPSGGVHTGREAAERTLRAVFSAFLDLTIAVEHLIIDGDQVSAVLSMEGTHIGDFLGLPPTGKRFNMSAVFFYEVKNGRIVRERRIYDFTGMLVQIGILKAKPA
jgi:steroid delta-isomerase-like uncharacterized protein